MCKKIFVVIFLNFFSLAVLAQGDEISVVQSERKRIESDVLSESVELWISKPQDYDSASESYPVLYLLDGDTHFFHATSSIRTLAGSGMIPNLIVVAILNRDRGRDFTPLSQNNESNMEITNEGGADKFLKFLTDELVPQIDNSYRTNSYKLLAGHSLGGLFTLYTLMSKPEAFNAYLAISPSLQWSNQLLVDQANHFFHSVSERENDLYLTVANEGGDMLGGAITISGFLSENTPGKFRWKFDHLSQQNHNSIPVLGIYYGLQSVFEGWTLKDPMKVYDIGGFEAVQTSYVEGGRRFNYERSMPPLMILSLVDQLIVLNRLDEAAILLTDKFEGSPPSYFLNLLGQKYNESGDKARAEEFYKLSLKYNPTDSIASARLTEMGIDVASMPPTLVLSEAVLKRYVGNYEPMPGLEMRVYMEGATLFQQIVGQPSAELVPLTESRFSVRGADSQVEFFDGPDSLVDRIMIYQFGREIGGPKIE